jgi:Toprim domain
MKMGLDFQIVDQLIGGKFGTFDVACPLCGPERRSHVNQERRVLRIWRTDDGFASFRCARCEEEGFVRRESGRADNAPATSKISATPRYPDKKVRDEAADRQRAKARWLWGRRRPLIASVAERYLREIRGYGGTLPEAIGYLPESGEHCACMISAMGLSRATAAIEVQAVHLTKLAPDGRKAGTESDKIVVGSPRGAPIVLAPVNDGLGLIIAEGIEDALSVHEATGMGAWAAGSAPLLPYLADVVPGYVECVTCIVDDDKAGRRKSDELAAKLEARGIETRLFYPARSRAA